MQNSFVNGLRVNSIALFALLCIGCGSDDTSTLSIPKEPLCSYAILGPISNANVTILRAEDNISVYETKTQAYANETKVVWPQNRIGSFEVNIKSSIDNNDLMLVSVSGGEDTDPDDDGLIVASEFLNFSGKIYAYATAADLKANQVYVNAFSTLAAAKITPEQTPTQIMQSLSLYAQKIFRLSVNGDDLIDYRDLFAYVPNYTEESKLIKPGIYAQMHKSGFIEALLNGDDISLFINSDTDGDGLSWEEEMLFGSDPSLMDTDSDGLNDRDEMLYGLNPASSDSDFDGIDDMRELILGTDPLNSDTDGDYLPDGVEVAQGSNPLVADEDGNLIVDGLDGDPLFQYQWHLNSSGTVVSNTKNIATIVGNDLGILNVYHYQLGQGASTIIQVVDTGVELLHEDLLVDTLRSVNAVTGTNDPTSTNRVSSDPYAPMVVGHGTAVAGIIAARANNGKGLRGVVPNAAIAGSNWLEEQSLYELDRAWSNTPDADAILVSNNSWGTYVLKDTSFEEIMQPAIEQLRGGKGRIFTMAAGNSRESYGNANLSYVANNRYVVTVASLNFKNEFASYSNPGSNVLVSAYGGESYFQSPTIATTLLMGKSYYESELGTNEGAITFDEDTSKNYTFAMNGTSGATPMVSGAVALVLESCPELTWRDVKWLIAKRSKKIDPDNDKWVLNAAGNSHNVNYGFGLIDADAIIQACRSPYYKNLNPEKSAFVSMKSLNIFVPDTNTSVSIPLEFSDSFTAEWVELTFDSDHTYAGDLEIRLRSPSGTWTQLITPNELKSAWYKDGFRFSSAAFVGEKSNGVWTIEVTDRLKTDFGTIHSLQLQIYGH